MGLFLNETDNCDLPISHIFRGLQPSKMPAGPWPGSIPFVSELKSVNYWKTFGPVTTTSRVSEPPPLDRAVITLGGTFVGPSVRVAPEAAVPSELPD